MIHAPLTTRRYRWNRQRQASTLFLFAALCFFVASLLGSGSKPLLLTAGFLNLATGFAWRYRMHRQAAEAGAPAAAPRPHSTGNGDAR